MDKYVCNVCGYEYDPEVGDPDNGLAPGTAFEDLPDTWTCPMCGVGKDEFSKKLMPPAGSMGITDIIYLLGANFNFFGLRVI